jgi:hypothetical protein
MKVSIVVDIQTISIAIASASITLAAIYYVWQIRHQSRIRQTDLVTKLSYDISTNSKFIEASVDVVESEFKDYDDFKKKYGKLISKNQIPMSFTMIGNFYEQVGVLLKNKLVDASLIDQLLPVTMTWEKMEPMVEGMRKEYHDPHTFEWFEYLYNEIKKREQKLQST